MSVEFSDFKGNKMISIKKGPEDKFAFSFGRTKAKLIMENYEAIKKFAEDEGEENEKQAESIK